MNYIDIPIFYINLKKDNDRNESFIKDASKYNLDINRVDGIYGNDFKDILQINEKNYKIIIKYKRNKPIPAQLGCCLSHLKAIIQIKDLGLESALIMEDDIDFSLIKKWSSFINFKDILKSAPKNWELIKLHSSNRINQNIIYNQYLKESKLYSEIEPYDIKKNWSTMCYIINKTYINSFFERYYKDNIFIFDIDYFVADIVLYFNKNIYDYTIPLFKSKNFDTNIFYRIKKPKNPFDEKSNIIIDNFWENIKI